ncbi:hypothetical protein BJX66DRAFT_329502 [Aspergillus keveii]|uniref:Uncharacterized protein n=1 Tax=Aspergillus keveii TaxID=714993 RepID=A0ABR4FPG7_9EURO
MSGRLGGFLSSPLFTFVVCEAKKGSVVHSGALGSLSPALNVLMNGNMIEASTRRVEWPHVDEHICSAMRIRLLARLYATSALCVESNRKKKLPEASPKPPKDVESCTLDYNGNGNPGWSDDDPVAGEKPISNPSLDQSTFHDDELPYRARSLWSFGTNLGRKGKLQPSDDFTLVFAGHVQLCSLADKYCIKPLTQLVLFRIKETLEIFKLCDANVGDVVELIWFVYDCTPNIGKSQRSKWTEDGSPL